GAAQGLHPHAAVRLVSHAGTLPEMPRSDPRPCERRGSDRGISGSVPAGGGRGAPEAGCRCVACGSRALRAGVVGAGRTAEELGRMFPGVRVRTSGGGEILESVPAEPAIVVSTPGAEPVAEGGYGAALLLDSWALL